MDNHAVPSVTHFDPVALGMYLRRVSTRDIGWYMSWVNDLETRIRSLSSGSIPREDQLEWIKSARTQPVYVLCGASHNPLAQVSITVHEHNCSAQIGLVVPSNQQGKGYASLMLSLLPEQAVKYGVQKLYARVLTNNNAIRSLLLKNDYIFEGRRVRDYYTLSETGCLVWHDMDVYYTIIGDK